MAKDLHYIVVLIPFGTEFLLRIFASKRDEQDYIIMNKMPSTITTKIISR